MPLSVTSAGGSKGSFYGDASYRTAAIRKQAILAGQTQKCTSSSAGASYKIIINYVVDPMTLPVVYYRDLVSLSSKDTALYIAYLTFLTVLDPKFNQSDYDTAVDGVKNAGGSFPINEKYYKNGGVDYSRVYLGNNFANDMSVGNTVDASPNATSRIEIIFEGGGGSSCNILSSTNALKKPLIGEHHLQKGFTGGVIESIVSKNPNGFI